MARDRKKSKENKRQGRLERRLSRKNEYGKKDPTPASAVLHIANGGDINDYIIL